MGKVFDKFWQHAALLFAFTQLLYVKSWFFGLTFLDDNDVVIRKSRMLAQPGAFGEAFTQTYFANLTRVYYRPIVNLSFVVDARLGGANPFVYHLTNTLLHGCMCVLLLGLMWQLRYGKMPSLGAALYFAVHPINVSSVAWIPGRNDVLLGCFALGALILLHRAIHQPSTPAVVGHALCFIGALLTKETALMLPVCFIVLMATCDQWQRQLRRPVWAATWLCSTGLYIAARSLVTKTPDGYFGNALHSAWEHRSVLLSDIGKLLVPVRLQVMATHKDVLLWPGLLAILLLFSAVWLRDVRRKVVHLAVVLMLTTLLMALLASDFILLENRLYLAIAGLCLWMAEILRSAGERGKRVWRTSVGLWCALTLVFAVRTLTYSELFRDKVTFANAAIKSAPGSYLAMRLHFGNARLGSGLRRARPASATPR